ncbi:MAG: response regulator [Anaerolineales bacterium]|nr:response regulator [Anaerolineales bacterium]
MPEEVHLLEATPLVETPPAEPPTAVLVVDDEPRNLEVLTHILGTQGFQILTAEDGEEALDKARAALPDVILLDVVMPQMDGFEVCRQLKADPATLYIPVALITALRGVRERTRGAEAGADEFISKPFDSVELLTRVRSLARIKRLYDQLRAANHALEQRVAERTAELQRALRELRELDRLKSEFIANVSHELRTPLLHVKGTVTLLTDGALGTLTSEQMRGLHVAEEAAEQLERVVEDVIDFNEVHGRVLDLEPVPVAEACQSAYQALLPRIQRRHVNVRLAVPSELPPVRADALALSRVIRHLLDNAVKFSPPDGLVQILAERRGEHIRISVQDQGPGIPPDERQRIFTLFYQSDGSSTRRAGGMGLGLALVRKLLTAHGTQIELESEVGRGSSFAFDLPIAHPA